MAGRQDDSIRSADRRPTVSTGPWKLASNFIRNHIKDADYEQRKVACHEGERSADKMIIPANVAKENAARAKLVNQK